jgi:hypothetical protein
MDNRGYSDTFLLKAKAEDARMVVILFVRFLRDLDVKPASVLSGVRFLFISNNADATVFESEQVRGPLKNNETAREIIINKQQRYRCPLTVEMITWMIKNGTHTLTERMICYSIVSSFNFLWRISQSSRDADENNRLKKLSQSDVAKMIKWTASSFNLDPKHFSTHSMRIGSATALLAAGHED